MRRPLKVVRGFGCGVLAAVMVACGTAPEKPARPRPEPVDSKAAGPTRLEIGSEENVLVLEGPVDEAMRQQFQAAVESRPVAAVRITSAGNPIKSNTVNLPALWMAEAIRERGIEVIVRGLCAESCANYIFVAGRKRRVEENSLVLFGPSVTTLRGIQQSVGDMFPADFEPMFRSLDPIVSSEQRFFAMRGVPLSLLSDSVFARQPKCVAFYRTDGITPQSYSISMHYAAWIPSRQYLDAAGVSMEGYWPASRKEMVRVLSRLASSGLARVTRYADEDHLRPARKAPYKLQDLQQCVLEQVAP